MYFFSVLFFLAFTVLISDLVVSFEFVSFRKLFLRFTDEFYIAASSTAMKHLTTSTYCMNTNTLFANLGPTPKKKKTRGSL